MSDLKSKTISGLIWSFIGSFSNQIVTFIVGIILARLVTPYDYGLIGMVSVLIVIAQTFIDGGFKQALLRKKDCTDIEYSTVFLFNIATAIVLYVIIFFSAKGISNFFGEPQLVSLVKVIALSLIINSFSVIQATIFSKNVDFKTQSKISFFAAILSGIVGVILAYRGFGVWSLVYRAVLSSCIISSLFWFYSRWRPSLAFSIRAFKELFGFGSKLLLSSLIDQIYWNIYYVIIGKYFSVQTLGYYTRAEMFKNLPSQNLTTIITSVSLPVLAQMQDNSSALKHAFRRIFKVTMYVTFISLIIMIVMADTLIFVLIGPQWAETIGYLKLLCVAAMFFPASLLNINIIKIKGRGDLILKLEVIKKTLAIASIVIGVYYGIYAMMYVMIFNAFIDFILNSIMGGILIGHRLIHQIADVLPSLLNAGFIGGTLYYISTFLNPFNLLTFLILSLSAVILVVFCGELFKESSYLYIKNTIVSKLKMTTKQ